MENDVLNKKHILSKEETHALNVYNNTNNQEYSTIERSMEMTSTTTYFDLYKGFIYMFLSCFTKSLFAIFCKLLLERNTNISSYHLLTFKAYIMLVISIGMCIYYHFHKCVSVSNLLNFSRASLNLILLRSVLSVLSISLTIFALRYASISEVYTVFYIYPGVVILLSFLILKEKVNFFDLLCLFSCFTGVILVIRPSIIFSANEISKPSIFIFSLVIIGAMLKACEDIIIRNVGKDISCLVVPAIYSIVGIVLYPIPMGITIDHTRYAPVMDGIDLLFVFLIAIFSFIYQALMTLAIQNENAGRVSMVNYFQVFFMFISDIFIFNRKIILLDLIGTLIIFGFNLANGIKKTLKRNHQLKILKNCTPKEV